ncbi:spore coat protein GerQ [Paenibacillus pasadenensis]|uniref:Ipa-62r n=2 Tax=Paenibacillus TaxID=44249 RepID=A0A2N5NAB6_9BACL|nr:spore coat protein GerQ [Paenibacillus pasadenensis]PLT47297.1 Ipa-62r [Paenibacillus pasadenensis]QGG57591.1 spore coat protein GerQ [Paenibacillus sp. B01]
MSNVYDYRMYAHGGYPGMPMQSPYGGNFVAMPPAVPSGAVVTPQGGTVQMLPATEESYVENILRLNRGKMATFYMTYENNKEWNAKIFRGIVEAAGRDHIIISDPSTGMRYLLLTLNLDYVTFDGPIAYEYSFQGQTITNQTPAAQR